MKLLLTSTKKHPIIINSSIIIPVIRNICNYLPTIIKGYNLMGLYLIKGYSDLTALRCVSFLGKKLKKRTCAVMIRITITFGNQIFL